MAAFEGSMGGSVSTTVAIRVSVEASVGVEGNDMIEQHCECLQGEGG